MTRRWIGVVVLALALAAVSPTVFRRVYSEGRVPAILRDPGVIFVVLDDVRADHTSLCGYERPTTPTLQRLVRDGASFSCGARAPGSWTLPSHASFFTGEAVTVHRAHETGDGLTARATSILANGLDDRLPTLAEQMAVRGFQTLALSANPVVSTKTGLLRGFEASRTAEKFGDLIDGRLPARLQVLLRMRLDPFGGPLFLFVNVLDAHNPWRAVPAGLGWVPARAALGMAGLKREGIWRRFLRGEATEAEGRALVDHITDVYDYGIWRADRNLAAILRVVEDSGWCGRGCRLVVVSDHGEFLGEKGLLDHGHYVWEPDARVPLLVAELGTGTAPAELPPQIAGVHAYHLVRDGALPPTLAPMTMPAWAHTRRCDEVGRAAFCSMSAAVWEGPTKWVWMDGVTRRYDLSTDPTESAGVVAAGPPELDVLVREVIAQAGGGDLSPELMEALEAAGYVE